MAVAQHPTIMVPTSAEKVVKQVEDQENNENTPPAELASAPTPAKVPRKRRYFDQILAAPRINEDGDGMRKRHERSAFQGTSKRPKEEQSRDTTLLSPPKLRSPSAPFQSSLRSNRSAGQAPSPVRLRSNVPEVRKADELEYTVARVMGRVGSQYLIAWDGYNFTHCTYEMQKDLQHSKELLREYHIYEEGCKAIVRDLEETNWCQNLKKQNRIKLHHLPWVNRRLSDDELTRKMGDVLFQRSIGYWKLKVVELEWLKVLDPKCKGDRPPIYLEIMVAKVYIEKHLPLLNFITDYTKSPAAHNAMIEKPAKRHLCVFKEKEERCKGCAEWVELKITSTSTVEVGEYDTNVNYFVVNCLNSECICPGGWRSCRQWIPSYPRTVPLVIFYDPRYEWGIRALTHIPKGTIVSEYVGRVLTLREANQTSTNYQFGHESFVVDASSEGNESRFFAHSCQPNCLTVRLYVRGFDMVKSYRLLIITIRDIRAGEELTIDYHPQGHRRPRNNYAKCLCFQEGCRGWL